MFLIYWCNICVSFFDVNVSHSMICIIYFSWICSLPGFSCQQPSSKLVHHTRRIWVANWLLVHFCRVCCRVSLHMYSLNIKMSMVTYHHSMVQTEYSEGVSKYFIINVSDHLNVNISTNIASVDAQVLLLRHAIVSQIEGMKEIDVLKIKRGFASCICRLFQMLFWSNCCV